MLDRGLYQEEVVGQVALLCRGKKLVEAVHFVLALIVVERIAVVNLRIMRISS